MKNALILFGVALFLVFWVFWVAGNIAVVFKLTGWF